MPVSAVQVTPESKLPNFGAVGGRKETGKSGTYRPETVLEKPTPPNAEEELVVPGLRSAYYRCFFGIHVLTPHILELIGTTLARHSDWNVSLHLL